MTIKYRSESEQKHWDNLRKQFPYQWKTSELHIALAGGVTIGFLIGFLIGLVQ